MYDRHAIFVAVPVALLLNFVLQQRIRPRRRRCLHRLLCNFNAAHALTDVQHWNVINTLAMGRLLLIKAVDRTAVASFVRHDD